MLTRAEAVLTARAWLGTPYVKGARIRGAGCDCVTLLAEYLAEIGVGPREELFVYSQDWFCNTEIEMYRDGLSKYATCTWEGRCLGTPPALPGDIAIFRVAGSKVYNHGAILLDWPRAMHAFDVGVRESRPALHPLTSHRAMAIFNPWESRGTSL
jgi:cell wall-associated NlpC family hydrolase